MAIPDSIRTKPELRAAMRRRLRRPLPDSAPLAGQIGRWLGEHPAIHSIATFAALPGEPDLRPLVARHPERRWLFPKVVGESLSFHPVQDPATELCPGSFGILEPVDTLPVIPAAEIDAFLCPGLAFDAAGGRLGRGRGFYDRMLATARPGALRIGVCFPCQLVPDTFPEAHDFPMHNVISGA